MDYSAIHSCKIQPGIGIARLGDSETDFFVGPESPGDPREPKGGFKDLYGRIMRQAARFRVYAYDALGQILGEVTSGDRSVRISWSVQLANTKADWFCFAGVKAGMAADEGHPGVERRNKDEADRDKLKIRPAPRSIEGAGKSGEKYQMIDTFYEVSVYLGELRTDKQGRLLVLGGHGKSGTIDPTKHIRHYANNNCWYDDTSDGPVNAEVWVDGRKIETTGSWVIVAPPKYAASGICVVTLYDVMRAAVGQFSVPDKPSFTKDIYPLFARIAGYPWLNSAALRGHGALQAGNFLDPETLVKLRDSSDEAKGFRSTIFNRIRDPKTRDRRQANYKHMPPLSGDEGDAEDEKPDRWLYLLDSQYDIMKLWADGHFEDDWKGVPMPDPPIDSMRSAEEQVAALNRAALEPCIGGAFYPGIETTYIARNPKIYSEAFRFKQPPDLEPGDVTKRMAVPWQGDFYECHTNWWPTNRPDDVANEEVFEKLLEEFQAEKRRAKSFAGAILERIPWARGVGADLRFVDPGTGIEPENPPPRGPNGMVTQWSELGFVVPRQAPTGETVHVETGRSRYDGLSDREYFYIMLNLDSFPDFIPKAKKLAQAFLDSAERRMNDQTPGAVDDIYRPFPYAVEAFENRLGEIYNILKREAEKPYDLKTSDYQTLQDVVERVRQFAPFNQTDGAWLRNISQTGPIDEINALLFSIWADEAGEGTTEKNHANLYTRFLQSLGVELPPLNSRAYAFNPAFLDSAFTIPLLQLTVSQFTRTFFPEILGMTLRLEWEVLSLWPVIKIMEHFHLDPHFYRLHVGIDNASSGHGAKAKQAVQLHLDRIRAETGSEDEVQRQWTRIWNGYVAFRITGHLDEDLRALLRDRRKHPQTPSDRVIDLIVKKRPYGRLNHMDRKLGSNLINDWFDDPKGFIEQLKSKVTPGHPEKSELMRLISFDGPMYKVFNEDEIQIWHNWIVSLAEEPQPQHPIEVQVSMLIDHLRSSGENEPAHEAFQLWGPNPDHEGAEIQRSVTWWFAQPAPAFMKALSNAKSNMIVLRDPGNSRFFSQFVMAENRMGRALQNTVIDEKNGQQIIREWIEEGCPIPGEARPELKVAMASLAPVLERPTEAPWLSAFASDVERAQHPRHTIQGMAAVH